LLQSDAKFSGNVISANSAIWYGGGLALVTSDAVLNNNRITFNTAGSGGGLEIGRSQVTVANTTISDNRADRQGSGLIVGGGSTLRLLHTTLARNLGRDGSGIQLTAPFTDELGRTYSNTVALTNTILANQAVGIDVPGGNTVTVDSMLWHNTPITISQATTATVRVQNQYFGDPAFAPDGHHLTAGSAAIDKGLPAGVRVDIDGDTRDWCFPDLGADEFATGMQCRRSYLPIVYCQNP
jgi:hypothetical protein